MYKVTLFVIIWGFMSYSIAQSGIVNRWNKSYSEQAGVYTYQYITPKDTFNKMYSIQKYEVKHISNTLPLTNDTSYYQREIILCATLNLSLDTRQKGELPFEPLNIYYYDSVLCVICSFHIYPGNAEQYLDLKQEAGIKALIGGCYSSPYKLIEKSNYLSDNGLTLYKMSFFYDQYMKELSCPHGKYVSIDYYQELWYLHNIGFIYRHYCYENEDYYVYLSHIEGIPIDDYLINYKNTACKYYGFE